MKRKLLSLLLAITLIAVTVSVALPTTLASASENLIENGDFATYSGNTPANWITDLKSGVSTEMVEDVEIKDGYKVNAWKISTGETSTSKSSLAYNKTVKIERNAKYTMTYWVKVSKIPGFRTYMFEPNYVAKGGNSKTNAYPQEGENIYSYTYDNGFTRVIRADVKHSWTVAGTGTAIDNSTVSMFISRSNNVEQVLTPDYPSTTKEGQWLQVIHTFETGNSAAHEADVAYGFVFPSVAGGEVWIADLQMSVEKQEVDAYYAPAIADDTLGCITPYGEQPLYAGKEATFTAEAFGENTFSGWYVNDELVSEEETLTFVYDPENAPNYEARFTKAEFGIEDGSYENSAVGEVARTTYNSVAEWSDTAFINSSKDNLHYIDSNNTGDWRKATVTTEMAHSGGKSLVFSGQYGGIGRKLSGLQENTDYIVSVYAYTISPVDTSGEDTNVKGISTRHVTTADESFIKLNGTSLGSKAIGEDGLISKLWEPTETLEKWTKISYQFNTGDNTEVIFWIEATGYNAKLYLDDYSIARAPYKFKAKSNDYNLGFVPAVDVLSGEEVTVTASPIDGNSFEGWYVDGECVSTSLSYKFRYNDEFAQKLTAHFVAGEDAVPNAGFETGYTNGQLLAQISHEKNIKPGDKLSDEEKANYKTDWTETSFLNTNKDGSGLYYMESQYTGTYRKATITSAKAHTGKYSLLFNGSYGYLGKKFTGLEKNTTYAISFYYFVENADAYITANSITAVDQTCMTSTGGEKQASEVIAKFSKRYNPSADWEKATVSFNTGDNTEIIFWMYHSNVGNVYLDNFAIYKPIDAFIAADLGGDISSNLNTTSIPIGTRVELHAQPLEGNTFAGWANAQGQIVSTDEDWSFNATESFDLTAKFDGYNKPAREVFSFNGQDGTFENGTIKGWYADDPNYGDSVDWCKWTVVSEEAYEGNNSLRFSARFRNSVLPLTGLSKYTNYRLSYYVKMNASANARIDNMGVIGESETHYGTASNVFAKNPGSIVPGSGWNRVDLYFNSGEQNAVNFVLRYSTDSTAGIDGVYMDNVTLVQYEANDELLNGDFEQGDLADGSAIWIGEAENATDGSNVAKLSEGNSIYQKIATDVYSLYTVSFRAKGDLTLSAQDLSTTESNIKNYISSVSSVTTSGSDWKEYKMQFYSGVNQAVNLVAAANADGAMIDDITVVKEVDAQGAILEKIDFESERFAIGNNNTSFSRYYAENGDENVYSGNYSLKFTYNELLSTVDSLLEAGFLAYQPGTSASWQVSLKYKIADGKSGGTIKLAPDYSGATDIETGFEQSADDDEWQDLNFFFTNGTYASMKLMLGSIAGSTESDFYVDDIVIKVAPPMVSSTSIKTTYCEALYNAIDNESFEQAISDKNWKDMTSNMKVITGDDALKGTHYLRATANTHYVLEVDVKPSTEYYFAASVRGTAKTTGFIGVSLDAEGTELYSNRELVPASAIKPVAGSSDWERSGFSFITSATGKAYVVIDVTSGYMDLDSVMLFTSDYGYRYDPNDYTIYTSYDYDNLKSSTTVINGGFGPQPYYTAGTEGADGTVNPDTGDDNTFAATMVIVLTAALGIAVLTLIKKRKEGAANA